MSDEKNQTFGRRPFLKTGTSIAVLGTAGLSGCSGGGGNGDGGDGGGSTSTPAPTDTSMDESTPSEEERLMEEANPPDPLIFAEFPVQLFWPVLYGMREGHFESRGLNVQLSDKPIIGGSRNISALLSGNVHMAGVAWPGPINLAREQDIFLKTIYPITVGSTENHAGTYLITHENTDSYSDFEGGAIATLAGGPGITVATIRRLLDEAGMDPLNDVEWRVMPLPQIPGAVAREEIVGGSGFEPGLSSAMQGGLPIKKFDPLYGFSDPTAIAGPWTTPDFAEQHPATLKLFQRGLSAAIGDVREDPRQFAAVVGEHLDVNEDIVVSMVERGDMGHLPLEVQEGRPLASLQTWQSLLQQYIEDIPDRDVDVSRLILPWNRP